MNMQIVKELIDKRLNILDEFSNKAENYVQLMDNPCIQEFLQIENVTSLWLEKTDNMTSLTTAHNALQTPLSTILKEEDKHSSEFDKIYPLNLSGDDLKEEYIKLYKWLMDNIDTIQRCGFLQLKEQLWENHGFDYFWYLKNQGRSVVEDYEVQTGINFEYIQMMSECEMTIFRQKQFLRELVDHLLLLDKRYWKSINAPEILQEI